MKFHKSICMGFATLIFFLCFISVKVWVMQRNELLKTYLVFISISAFTLLYLEIKLKNITDHITQVLQIDS